ncbi:MAG: hypothetical protein IJ848_02060 [Alphaproteobacteria bacterium]|nr:hypothetical protein [Alphaproteobacteria bacterium]
MNDKTICLLDISGFIYRAYYATQHITHNNIEVGALFGFCTEMLKILSVFKDSIFVAAMDCSRHTFRSDIYPEYKNNRKHMPDDLIQQLPLISECCEQFGFNIIKCNNYEADDVIASFVNHYNETHEVVVVSPDKDLLQLLVFNNTRVYNPIKHKFITDQAVVDIFGVTKEKIADILALSGDKSDNIPGAFGIGPKTAAKLINEYGSIENILKYCSNSKVQSSKENIILSKKLVTLEYNLNIDYNINYKYPNNLTEYFQSFGFYSLINRLRKIIV